MKCKLSLSTGLFPDSWEVNHVSPIFKGSDKNQIKNYHPIVSIVLIIPKILKITIHTNFTPLFRNYNKEEQYV